MLNFIQNGTDPVTQRPPRLQQDERLDEESVCRKSSLPVPPAVEIGDQRAGVIGLLEDEASHAVSAPAGEPLHVLAQRRFETPFCLGALAIRLRRVPPPPMRSVPREVVFYPLAAADELFFGRPA